MVKFTSSKAVDKSPATITVTRILPNNHAATIADCKVVARLYELDGMPAEAARGYGKLSELLFRKARQNSQKAQTNVSYAAFLRHTIAGTFYGWRAGVAGRKAQNLLRSGLKGLDEC
jgi:hypothetical protein